jgi:hypothetical protein
MRNCSFWTNCGGSHPWEIYQELCDVYTASCVCDGWNVSGAWHYSIWMMPNLVDQAVEWHTQYILWWEMSASWTDSRWDKAYISREFHFGAGEVHFVTDVWIFLRVCQPSLISPFVIISKIVFHMKKCTLPEIFTYHFCLKHLFLSSSDAKSELSCVE